MLEFRRLSFFYRDSLTEWLKIFSCAAKFRVSLTIESLLWLMDLSPIWPSFIVERLRSRKRLNISTLPWGYPFPVWDALCLLFPWGARPHCWLLLWWRPDPLQKLKSLGSRFALNLPKKCKETESEFSQYSQWFFFLPCAHHQTFVQLESRLN